MSEDVRVIIKGNRGNPPVMTQIWPNVVAVQLDEKDVQERTTYEGADPNYLYDGYITTLPVNNPLLLQLHDTLIDQNITDPTTGKSRLFKICGKPAPYPDGHIEFVCYWKRGGN